MRLSKTAPHRVADLKWCQEHISRAGFYTCPTSFQSPYIKGCLAGTPGRRGYFWGVGASFSTTTRFRRPIEWGSSKPFTSRKRPPKTLRAT